MNYKLDIAGQAVVCRVLAAGGTMQMAADAVGCTRRALYAAAEREPDFAKRIKQSQCQSKEESLITLAEAAKDVKHWQAAYKRLRMLYPDDYSRNADTIPAQQASRLIREFTALVKWSLDDADDRRKFSSGVKQMLDGYRLKKRPKWRQLKRQVDLKALCKQSAATHPTEAALAIEQPGAEQPTALPQVIEPQADEPQSIEPQPIGIDTELSGPVEPAGTEANHPHA